MDLISPAGCKSCGKKISVHLLVATTSLRMFLDMVGPLQNLLRNRKVSCVGKARIRRCRDAGAQTLTNAAAAASKSIKVEGLGTGLIALAATLTL